MLRAARPAERAVPPLIAPSADVGRLEGRDELPGSVHAPMLAIRVRAPSNLSLRKPEVAAPIRSDVDRRDDARPLLRVERDRPASATRVVQIKVDLVSGATWAAKHSPFRW